jgi:hypothetical protein
MTMRSPFVVLSVVVVSVLLAAEARANCGSFAAKTGTALAAAQGLARASSSAKAPDVVPETKDKGEKEIVGLWETAFLQDKMVVDRAFETFTTDGNELLVDTTPPTFGNVCNGVWASLGHRTYRIKHPSWIFADDSITLKGTALLKTKLVLNKNGNEFTGQITILFYDLDGMPTDPPLTFDLKGTRIVVD